MHSSGINILSVITYRFWIKTAIHRYFFPLNTHLPWSILRNKMPRDAWNTSMVQGASPHQQITAVTLFVCLFEGCVLVVSVIEQLAQWHNSTVKAAMERLCNYIPGKYQIIHHMLCWYCCISLLIKNSHVESEKALSTSCAASQTKVAER